MENGVVCQEKGAPMITDSNQACFAELAIRGLQIETYKYLVYCRSGLGTIVTP
jgi:hypothetical protein